MLYYQMTFTPLRADLLPSETASIDRGGKGLAPQPARQDALSAVILVFKMAAIHTTELLAELAPLQDLNHIHVHVDGWNNTTEKMESLMLGVFLPCGFGCKSRRALNRPGINRERFSSNQTVVGQGLHLAMITKDHLRRIA